MGCYLQQHKEQRCVDHVIPIDEPLLGILRRHKDEPGACLEDEKAGGTALEEDLAARGAKGSVEEVEQVPDDEHHRYHSGYYRLRARIAY